MGDTPHSHPQQRARLLPDGEVVTVPDYQTQEEIEASLDETQARLLARAITQTPSLDWFPGEREALADRQAEIEEALADQGTRIGEHFSMGDENFSMGDAVVRFEIFDFARTLGCALFDRGGKLMAHAEIALKVPGKPTWAEYEAVYKRAVGA